MQKEVVGHNNSAEDAHDNGTGTCGKRRHDPALGGLGPPHLHERKLCQEGKADERDEADDPALYMLVGVRGKKDERDSGCKNAADLEGKRKEHLERDGGTQDLCQSRRHCGKPGSGEKEAGRDAGKVLRRGLCKAVSRDDAEVRGIVLQHDEHERRERHDPQERIAELGSCCHVGCPVARVDEADGHEKAWSDMLQDFEAAVASGMLAPVPADKLFCMPMSHSMLQ